MVDGTGTSTWTWDSLGRLTSTVDGAGTTIGYRWDLNGNNTKIAYPGGNCDTGVRCVTQTFDDASRLTQITDWGGRSFGYTPDENSNDTKITFPAGTGNVDDFRYDRADRFIGATFSKGASVSANIDNGRSSTGLVSSETTTGLPGGANRYWGYDVNDRLCWQAATAGTNPTCVAPPAGASTWGYDNADNLTKRGDGTRQAFDPANQLCNTTSAATTCTTPGADPATYAYDSRGNRTEMTPPASTQTSPSTFGYDLANRLTTATVPKLAGNSGEYTALEPTRIASTIDGTGFPAGQFNAGDTKSVTVAGVGGVPANGVAAVVVNVTAANATGSGYLTVFPSDQAVPATSNVNYTTATIANAAVVRVGADGKIKVANANASVDVIVDVQGWYSTAGGAAGGTFTPLDPARIADTRPAPNNVGVPAVQVQPGQSVLVPVCGHAQIPSCADGDTNVGSVTVNVTVPSPAAAGFLTVFPADQAVPATNNVSFAANQTIAGLAVVKVATSGADAGKIAVFNGSTVAVDVVVDAYGWSTIAETAGGADFVAATSPARLFDTRPNLVPVNGSVSVPVAGQLGMPATGITAVSVNVTVTDGTGAGFVTLYPSGTARPATSNLNYVAGQTISNAAVTKVGVDGRIAVHVANASANVIIDVNGYYTASTGTWTYTYDGDGVRTESAWVLWRLVGLVFR